MFGIMLYDIIFFGIPAVLLASFGMSAYRYFSAKKINKSAPGTYTDEEIKNRKTVFVVFAVIAAIVAMVVIGLIALLFMAVAFM